MVDTLTSLPASPPAQGLAARVFGVLTSPRSTYADVAAHPRSLGVLLVVLTISIASSSWFLSTEVGQQAVVDQQLETIESFGEPSATSSSSEWSRWRPIPNTSRP